MSSKRASKRPTRARRPQSIFWTDRALSDLEAISDYIAQDNPTAADRWVKKIFSVVENAAAIPLAGRRVPELAREDVREVFLRTYRIVYALARERIEVLTVFEGHRRFPDTLSVPESEN